MKQLLTGIVLGAVAMVSFQLWAGTLTTPVPSEAGFSETSEEGLRVDFVRETVRIEILNGTERVGRLVLYKDAGAVQCKLLGKVGDTVTPDCSGFTVNQFDNWIAARQGNAETILTSAGVYQ